MRFFSFVFFLSLFIFSPTPLHAEGEACVDGTKTCACPNESSVTVTSGAVTSSSENCKMYCVELSDSYPETMTGYSYTCENASGTTVTIKDESFSDIEEALLAEHSYGSCEEDSYRCECQNESSFTKTSDDPAAKNAENCDEYCVEQQFEQQTNKVPVTVVGFTYSCIIDGSRITLNQDDYEKREQDYINNHFGGESIANLVTSSTKEPSEDIIPTLSIDIPGYEEALQEELAQAEEANTSANILGIYITSIYKLLLVVSSFIAVIILMIGGLQYMIARGDSSQISAAKTRIEEALFGLVLIFSAYTIASLIDPNLVTFTSLDPGYIDPKAYVANSGDAAGSSKLDISTLADSWKCNEETSIAEIAAAAVGNICYRFGGKGGPAPYSAETKTSPSGVSYSTFCPNDKLCFDCSGYVDYLRTCKGWSSVGESGGTAGIFLNAEKAQSCTATDINGQNITEGSLIGWPTVEGETGHVFMYIGNGQVTDSHGGTDGRECNAVTIKELSWVCSEYINESHGLYIKRR